MPQILFLCTGNYYRSRLAEILFNHWAAAHGSKWEADSRGLRITGSNVGPLSQHTKKWLADNDIPLPEVLRMPIPVKEADFWKADKIIAVKEAEHRDMIGEFFPHWVDRVEYWDVHDLDVHTPEQALPELVALVKKTFDSLHTS